MARVVVHANQPLLFGGAALDDCRLNYRHQRHVRVRHDHDRTDVTAAEAQRDEYRGGTVGGADYADRSGVVDIET